MPRTIKELQTFLGVEPDGSFGPKSMAALDAVLSPPAITPIPVANPDDHVDPRSESAITTLHRKVQPVARQMVKLAMANGIKIEITSGTRTYAEQQALFDRHDGTTRAPAGYSNHNFGLAFDVTIDAEPDDKLEPVWESPLYQKLGKLGESLGLTWGGEWQSIVDEPHFELHPHWAEGMSENQMLSELRRRHDNGIDAFI